VNQSPPPCASYFQAPRVSSSGYEGDVKLSQEEKVMGLNPFFPLKVMPHN